MKAYETASVRKFLTQEGPHWALSTSRPASHRPGRGCASLVPLGPWRLLDRGRAGAHAETIEDQPATAAIKAIRDAVRLCLVAAGGDRAFHRGIPLPEAPQPARARKAPVEGAPVAPGVLGHPPRDRFADGADRTGSPRFAGAGPVASSGRAQRPALRRIFGGEGRLRRCRLRRLALHWWKHPRRPAAGRPGHSMPAAEVGRHACGLGRFAIRSIMRTHLIHTAA